MQELDFNIVNCNPMKKTTLLLFLLPFLFFSFTNKKPAKTEKPQGLVLKQIVIDSELFLVFTYTREHKIREEKSKYMYTKYTYNDNNQLISRVVYMDGALTSSDNRVYEAAKKRKEWVTPLTANNILTTTFEYDNTGKLVKDNHCTFKYDKKERISSALFYTNGKPDRYISYKYDGRGNLVKLCDYDSDTSGHFRLMDTKEYEFDNKINPFKSFGYFAEPGQYTNPNNIIKEKYSTFFTPDSGKPGQITKIDYTYNAEGYPLKDSNHRVYIYY